MPFKGYTAEIKRGVLVLARHPGPCIRPFPGSPEGRPPTEFYVAHANGCPFDCAYCFLQGYFDHGAPVLFVNREDLVQELADHLKGSTPNRPVAYHAGELSDGLALEGWSGFAADAIPLFRAAPHAGLELRTKCAGVEGLLPAGPPSNVTVSWTLTPRETWKALEHRTPDPLARLRSARACREKGYPVGIRLDPAVIHPGWEAGYRELIEQIYEHLPPEGIESLVIGGFRYAASVADRIRERFPSNRLLLQEFVRCRDGKHRYFRPLRVRLYRWLVERIRAHDADARILLCMETDQVHKEVFLEDTDLGVQTDRSRPDSSG